jgi:hypothetical protein
VNGFEFMKMMSAQQLYGIQSSSRRILFSEDDVKSLITVLTSARLSQAENKHYPTQFDEEEEDDDGQEDLKKHQLRKPLQELKSNNSGSSIQASPSPSSDSKLSLFTSAPERRFVLGGSPRRVEREDTPKSSGFKLILAPGSTSGIQFPLSTGVQSLSSCDTSSDEPSITALPVKRLIRKPIFSGPATTEQKRTPLSNDTTHSLESHQRSSPSGISPFSSAKLDLKKKSVGWSPNNISSGEPLEDTVSSHDIPDTHEEEQEYQYLNILGKGSFGKVLLAEHKPSKLLVAIKVLDRKKLLERGNLRRAHMEIRCLEKCAGPFIVSLVGAFETKTRLYIVQDFCNGGELFSVLSRHGRLPLTATRFYAAQCAVALDHLHMKRFAYRDLKTENIMLDRKGNVRLVDFGLVKEGISQPERGSRSFVGTTEYIAPEMLTRKGHGFAVDWWALGVVIHELLTGLPPWYVNNASEMHRRVLYDPLVLASAHLSDEACTTIVALLEKQPLKRLGSNGGLIAVRKSPFFRELDWEKLIAEELTPPFVPELNGDRDLKYFSDEFLSLSVEL